MAILVALWMGFSAALVGHLVNEKRTTDESHREVVVQKTTVKPASLD